jgi:hypothetical protein
LYSHGFYVQTVTKQFSKETNSCTAAHDPGLKAKHMHIGTSHVLVFFFHRMAMEFSYNSEGGSTAMLPATS